MGMVRIWIEEAQNNVPGFFILQLRTLEISHKNGYNEIRQDYGGAM